MKSNLFLRCTILALILLHSCKNKANVKTALQEEAPELRIEIIAPEALTVLDSAAKIEVIGKGFQWTEGPLYIEDGNYLLFSDIPTNKIYKWSEGDSITTYLTPAGNTGTPKENTEQGSNGLLLNANGELVLCQHGDRRIAKMNAPLNNPKPNFASLADKYQGKRFNSPNDAVYHSNGDLYFTDPPYGLPNGIEDSTKELDMQGVYRLKPTGQLDLVTDKLKYPNGIAISPDGKFLYVASSDPKNYVWMQYELDEKGLAKNEKVFYEAHSDEGKNYGAPDGLKITKGGYIFATGPQGVWVFTSSAKLIARIYTGQLTSNCALSPDEKVLYMTCDDFVMRLKLKN